MFRLDSKSKTLKSQTIETIRSGVNGFGLATFCKDETLMLWAFFENLIQTKTPMEVVQATFNTIKNKGVLIRNKKSLTAFLVCLETYLTSIYLQSQAKCWQKVS